MPVVVIVPPVRPVPVATEVTVPVPSPTAFTVTAPVPPTGEMVTLVPAMIEVTPPADPLDAEVKRPWASTVISALVYAPSVTPVAASFAAVTAAFAIFVV